MQHLVDLVRAAAAEVPLSPVPAVDIETVKWTGKFDDLISLGLCSTLRANTLHYWNTVLGDLDNFRPTGIPHRHPES